MKLLLIGDIVSSPGRAAVAEVLPALRKENNFDLVIANAENLAHGRGATLDTLAEMQNLGIDFFTSGEHIFWHKGFDDEIDSLPFLIRPANYPEGTPGEGYKLIDLGAKGKILLINLIGRAFFNNNYDDFFRKVDAILEEHSHENITLKIIDIHAEASSEKYALGFYLDGKVDIIYGTHTHVPTCDHRILPKGTYFVSDLGMTGAINSVIGVKTEIILNLMLTSRNQRFEWEDKGPTAFRSVIVDTDNGSIDRYDVYLD